jgi:LPXTG-motif cell wall-anchored protein
VNNNATSSTTDQNAAPATSTTTDQNATSGQTNSNTNQSNSGQNLPQTASPLPLLGLLGFGSLAAGTFVRRRK